LIDWESGILAAMQPLFRSHGVDASPERILRLYVTHEAQLELQGWRPYREILREVSARIGADLGVKLSAAEKNLLPDSIQDWLPFIDTLPVLHDLANRFKLVILSNIDDALFAETQKRLEVDFALIITAEQVHSYKPGQAHFREALHRLNVPPGQILHVAQSLYHDHVPAKRLGLRTAWVKRPSRLTEIGLAPEAAVEPDIKVADLAGLLTILAPPKQAGA
jgi:2-haloacid dehalogenase